MPNPLSTVMPSATYSFAKKAAEQRPLHCAQIISTLSAWSTLESIIGSVFARILGAESEKGAAIYSALISGGSQEAAFDAAAAFVLDADDRDILAAIRGITKSPRDQRNQMAHGIWGISEQLPDSILLMPPKLLIGYVERAESFIHKVRNDPKQAAPPVPELDLSEILVYRHSDFESIQGQIADAHLGWHHFRSATLGGWPPYDHPPEEARRRLFANKEILLKVNKSRSSRGLPPLPPPEESGATPQGK